MVIPARILLLVFAATTCACVGMTLALAARI
jgi:hypothetical protein